MADQFIDHAAPILATDPALTQEERADLWDAFHLSRSPTTPKRLSNSDEPGEAVMRRRKRPPKRFCSIAECEKRAICRGLCATHYGHWLRLSSAERTAALANAKPELPRWEYQGDEAALAAQYGGDEAQQ